MQAICKIFDQVTVTYIALGLRPAGNIQHSNLVKYFCILPFKSYNICYILNIYLSSNFLSIEWNSIRLGGPAHEKVTKTVTKSLSGVVGVKGWWDGGSQGVVGVSGGGGVWGLVGECYSIDILPKL